MATRRSKSIFWDSSLSQGGNYDKFMRGNKPTQKVFGWLFDSIPFLADSADTAQTGEAGHIKIATNADIYIRKTFVAYADGHRRAVQPEQLPDGKTSLATDATDGDIALVNDTASPGNNYFYGTDGAGTKGWQDLAAFLGSSVPVKQSIEYDGGSLHLVNDATTPGNYKMYGTGSTGTKGWFGIDNYIKNSIVINSGQAQLVIVISPAPIFNAVQVPTVPTASQSLHPFIPPLDVE